jgi:hypothetical protein
MLIIIKFIILLIIVGCTFGLLEGYIRPVKESS